MTNPFIQAIVGTTEDNPTGTGNPFMDAVSPHANKDYDNLPWALGKSALGGILSIVTGPAGWGRKLENMEAEKFPRLAKFDPPIFTALANIGDKLQPNLDPAMANLPVPMPTGAGQTVGGITDATGLGTGLISGSLEFKGVGGALDFAAKKFFTSSSTRATMAIAKMAEGITIGARGLGASEETANAIGNTARVLPRNMAVGMATDLATNPDQTKQGMAQNAMLTVGLSMMEGSMYRKISPRLAPNLAIDPHMFESIPMQGSESDPDYLRRIKGMIGGIPPKSSKVPSVEDIYFNVMNRNSHLEAMERDLKSKGLSLSLAESPSANSRMANGTGPLMQMFDNQPFKLDEGNNPVPVDGAVGLKTIFEPLDTKDLRETFDAYALAKIAVDQGNLGTARTKFKNVGTGDDATIVTTAAGNNYVDYPDRRADHPTLESAKDELKANGYKQTSFSPMANPEKVNSGLSIQDALKAIKYVDENFPQVAKAHSQLMNGYLDTVKQFSSDLFTERGQRMFEVLHKNNIALQSLIDGKIVPPTYSAIQNTHDVIRAGIVNRIKNSLTDLADNYPDQMKDYIIKQKVPIAKETPMWSQVNNVMDNLKKYGLDYADNQEGALELVSKMGSPFVTPVDNNWSNMYSYKDGYIQRYTINKDLSETLQAINPAHINLFTQLMGWPARALAVGTVDNPLFGMVHAIRDSYNAFLNSKYGFRLGVDSWRGFKEALGGGEYKGAMNQERLSAGGGYSTLVDARDLLSDKKLASSVLPKTPGEAALNAIKHPIDLLANMTRPFLEAARIGEYMRAREAGATAFEAAMHSRSFIGDFGMKGASPVMQNLAYATAFMNPGLQSVDAMTRAIGDHPVGYAAKGMLSIGLFTALNYASNYMMGDDDINKVRQTPEGSNYWYTKLPGGKIFKTPKPFLPGQVFGTAIEAALDKFRGQNPDAFKQWAGSMAKSAEISIVPSILMTAANVYANKDNFSGRPIIPSNLQGVDPQYQQTPSTSNIAKAITATVRAATLGKANISPITMDYVLRSTLGTAGAAAEFATGNIGNVKREVGETPGISRFIAKYPTYAVQPIEQFYDKANEMDEVVRTANHLYKTNQIDAFSSYVTQNANKWAIAPVYSETKAQLNELRSALLTIENDPYISGQSKEEMRDYIISQQIIITDNVNKAIKGLL